MNDQPRFAPVSEAHVVVPEGIREGVRLRVNALRHATVQFQTARFLGRVGLAGGLVGATVCAVILANGAEALGFASLTFAVVAIFSFASAVRGFSKARPWQSEIRRATSELAALSVTLDDRVAGWVTYQCPDGHKLTFDPLGLRTGS